MVAKRSHTKAVLAFSIASLLIGVFAVLDACLLPVTWQYCHDDRGLSNHLCNDPYSPEGRRRDGGAEGEEAGMKAEPAKQRKGGRRGKREGRRGDGGGDRAEQQGPRQKQKGKRKQIFFLLAAGKEPSFITNRTLFRKKGQGERKFKKRWNSVPDNGGRINVGLEN